MARTSKITTEGNRRYGPGGDIRKLLPYGAVSIFIHITLIGLLMTIKMGIPQENRVAFVELVDLPRAVRLQKPIPGVLRSGKTKKTFSKKTEGKKLPAPENKPRPKVNKGEILRGKVPNLPVNPELPPEKFFPPEPEARKAPVKKKAREKRTSDENNAGESLSKKVSVNQGGGKDNESGKGGKTTLPDIKKITPSLGKMVIAAARKKAMGKGEGKGENIGSENEARKEGGFSEIAQGGTILTPLNSPSIKYISYFASIKRKIELVWQYPFDAIQRGIQGETIVDFSIGKNGKLLEVKLVESSGFRILDDEAMEAIRKAAPFGPIPRQYKIDVLKIRAHFIYEMHFLNIR